MKTSILILLVSSLVIFVSCSDDDPTGTNIDFSQVATADISFDTHVQPILNEYSQILQRESIYPEGLVIDSWNSLLNGWERGEVIIPFDSENSLLVELTTKMDYQDKLRDDMLDLLQRWIDAGAKNDAGEIPFANAKNRIYVCSQAEAIINIIDADRMVVMRNVDLTDFGFERLFTSPHHLAFSSDKKSFFVSCIDANVNRVLKFDIETNQLVGEAVTDIPALLAHHPSVNELYVSRFMLNNALNSIHVLNSETMQPALSENDGNIILPPGLSIAHAMALDQTGTFAYTASFAQDAFLVLNHTTKEFVESIDLGNDRTPLQITISPDNNHVYISCIGTGEIVAINVSDPNNRFEETAVTLGGAPWHSVVLPDGANLYTGNLMMNNFALINTATFTAQTFGAGDGSDGLSQPHGITMNTDGSRVFISNRNTTRNYAPRFDLGDNAAIGTVVAINTADNSIEKIIEIENFGSGMRFISLD